MRDFLSRKLIVPLLALLKQGVTPAKLAWAISAGIALAIIPVFGASTFLCLAAIWLFRLNPGAVLLVNQFAYPLQFILYIPFIRMGEWLFHGESLKLTVPQIFDLFQTDLPGAIKLLWWSTMYGIVVWAILSLPMIFILVGLLKAGLIKVLREKTS